MRIDKENYEVWMLDYLEGKLSGKQLSLFEQFLSEHPELMEQAEGVENIHLEASDRFFEDKNRLKAKMLKQVIDEEEQTTFDASEGNLGAEKKERLQKRLETSPRLQDKLAMYKEARLVADESIVFTGKDALRRTEKVIVKERTLWPYFVAAAMMAGIVYFVIPEGNDNVISNVPRRRMAELVSDSTANKSTLKKESSIQVESPIKKVEVVAPVEPTMANTPKVTNVGAIIKHEAINAPQPDLAQKTARPKKVVPAKTPAPVQREEPPIIKEPMVYQKDVTQQIAVDQTPKQVKQTKQGRSAPKGVPNANFVKTNEQLAEAPGSSKKKIVEAGSKFLARVTGDRLKIENSDANKVKVKFETQFLGFSKTF